MPDNSCAGQLRDGRGGAAAGPRAVRVRRGAWSRPRFLSCEQRSGWAGAVTAAEACCVLCERMHPRSSYLVCRGQPRLWSLLADTQRALRLLEEYRSKLSQAEDRQLRNSIERVISIFQSNLFQALIGKG